VTSVIAAAAITFVFVRGSIFDWTRDVGPRAWRDFASCPLCVGFWVGFALDLARSGAWRSFGRPPLSWDHAALGAAVVAGALAAIAALSIARVLDALETAEMYLEERARHYSSEAARNYAAAHAELRTGTYFDPDLDAYVTRYELDGSPNPAWSAARYEAVVGEPWGSQPAPRRQRSQTPPDRKQTAKIDVEALREAMNDEEPPTPPTPRA
jgi:hypothetical protein